MRIKNILSIAAFSTAFILSTAFAGLFVGKSENQLIEPVRSGYNARPTSCFKNRNKNAVAERITEILEQDDHYGEIREKKLRQLYSREIHSLTFKSPFERYADATSEYADESGGIEDDRLPQEFQAAWREHMTAWRDYADFLENTNSVGVESETSRQDFKATSNKYNTNIELTWYELLRVAGKYGSDFKPKY